MHLTIRESQWLRAGVKLNMLATPSGLRSAAFSLASSDVWLQLAQSAVLITGLPRSGTTWVAKIFDSHPAVLYRHEPDEWQIADPDLEPAEQIRKWLAYGGRRVAAKRPFFPKIWRSVPRQKLYEALAGCLTVAGRVPVAGQIADRVSLPNLIASTDWVQVRAAIKVVSWDAGVAARKLAGCRCLLILRHPCGQINSIMEGVSKGRFREGGHKELSLGLAQGKQLAATHGLSFDTFDALPIASRLAWTWRAFSEPALDNLAGLRNAKAILYEDLCRQPGILTRELFAFTDLEWNQQTADFLTRSTEEDGQASYYGVFRNTAEAPDRWREVMSNADQDAIRSILQTSPLAQFWPDLRNG